MQAHIISIEEFKQEYPHIFTKTFFGSDKKMLRFCKVEFFEDGVSGVLAVPRKERLTGVKDIIGFFLKEDVVIFIGEENIISDILHEAEMLRGKKQKSSYLVLLDFIETILKEDSIFLQQFEEKMSKMEEDLLSGRGRRFEHRLFACRRELTVLGAFYEQVAYIGESFRQRLTETNQTKEGLLFGICANKTGRLYSMVQVLKEYSVQLREMHQTQIAVRQNEIIKFLTIAATIFMPLTLITGWYGMNFTNMPEFTSPYSYGIVSIVCIVIIIVEVIVFRRKKWFR